MTSERDIRSERDPHGTDERREYLIDGFRVSYLHQAEWDCPCREFTAVGTCRHMREAAGMREAQSLIRRRIHLRPGLLR